VGGDDRRPPRTLRMKPGPPAQCYTPLELRWAVGTALVPEMVRPGTVLGKWPEGAEEKTP